MHRLARRLLALLLLLLPPALLAEVQLRHLGLAQDTDWRTTTTLDPAGQGPLTGA